MLNSNLNQIDRPAWIPRNQWHPTAGCPTCGKICHYTEIRDPYTYELTSCSQCRANDLEAQFRESNPELYEYKPMFTFYIFGRKISI